MAHARAGWSKMYQKAEFPAVRFTLAPAPSITCPQPYPKPQNMPKYYKFSRSIDNTIVDEPKSASGPSLSIASREKQLTTRFRILRTCNRAHSPSIRSVMQYSFRWSDNVMLWDLEGIHGPWYFDASKERASVRSELGAPHPALSLAKIATRC